MPNTYVGTAAALNGQNIPTFNMADQIQITDETPSVAGVTISGDQLHYALNGSATGGTITIGNLGPGRYVVREIGTTGTDIRLQEDAHNDFNGDGRSDILWSANDGTITDWLGTDTGTFNGNWNNVHNNPGTTWHVIGTGDFNGDGQSDILWQANDGTITDWLGTGSGTFNGNWNNLHTVVPTGWSVVGVADFNGDGIDDLLLRNSSGGLAEWLGQANGAFVVNSTFASTNPDPGSSWHVVGTGDFNGDGHADILWQANDGTVTEWLGAANGTFTGNWDNVHNNPGTSWHVVGTGDFNGDGTSDVLWRANDGTITDWLGTSNGSFSGNWNNLHTVVPTGWAVVSIGDYNHDTIDDLLLRSSSGGLAEWLGQTNGSFTVNSTFATYNPDPGSSWHVQDPFVHDPFG